MSVFAKFTRLSIPLYKILFRRQQSQPIGPVIPAEISLIDKSGSADLTDAEMHTLRFNRCPDCLSKVMYPGPSGGASQNYRCGFCGMGYNLSGFADHRIGLPYHIWDDKTRKFRSDLCALLATRGIRTARDNWGVEKDGHHGLWMWSYTGFFTIPDNYQVIRLNLWTKSHSSSGVLFDIPQFWSETFLQVPDPDFLDKFEEALCRKMKK